LSASCSSSSSSSSSRFISDVKISPRICTLCSSLVVLSSRKCTCSNR
jgi:hypothetical protein